MADTNGTTPQDSNPFASTIPLALTIRLLGVTKQVKRAKVKNAEIPDGEDFIVEDSEIDASKDELVTVNKRTLECPEYSEITSLAGEIRGFLKRKQVPGGQLLFRAGTYPIPVSRVEEVEKALAIYEADFRAATQKFFGVYEQRVKESRKRLGTQKVMNLSVDLSNEHDYPPLERVKKAFDIRHQWVSFGPPGSLAAVSKELYDKEMRRIREEFGTAAGEVKAALRSLFQKAVDSLLESLRPGEDGKKKAVKEGNVKKLQEFIDDFDGSNIVNDTQLESLVKKARQVLSGVDVKDLRTSDAVKKMTEKKLESVKKLADDLVTEAPIRRFAEIPD